MDLIQINRFGRDQSFKNEPNDDQSIMLDFTN